MPEQFEALGLDADAGGRQAIHKLQAWASSWELDAVREQDKEVAAMHNRAEQFDPSTEAIFIPFQVCCIVTDQGNLLGRPGAVSVCIAKQWLHCTSAKSAQIHVKACLVTSQVCSRRQGGLLSAQLTGLTQWPWCDAEKGCL